jgi:hypothetical protein
VRTPFRATDSLVQNPLASQNHQDSNNTNDIKNNVVLLTLGVHASRRLLHQLITHGIGDTSILNWLDLFQRKYCENVSDKKWLTETAQYQ